MPCVLAHVCIQPGCDSGFVAWYPDPTAPEQVVLWGSMALVLLYVLYVRLRRHVLPSLPTSLSRPLRG